MDGVTALHEIEKMEHLNKETIKVALTANALVGAKDYDVEAGFDNFISQPIDATEYDTLIMYYLKDKILLER